ncbi:MAG TPA: hypothetical protein VFY29_06150 [Terriglobia bacterium]|nr:hypothetical protein [Terriglobia bacterium]
MVEQLKRVLATYSRPMHWLIVALGLYVTFEVPGGMNVSPQRSFAWLRFFLLVFVIGGGVGVFVGDHLASAFSPARARLVPRLARAHFIVVAFLTTSVAVAAIHIGNDLPLNPAARLGQAGIAVAMVLVGVTFTWGPISSAFVIQILAFLPFLTAHYEPLGEAIDALGKAIMINGRSSAVLSVILLDCLGAIGVVNRVRRVHEESREIVRAAWILDMQAGRAWPQRALNRLDHLLAAILAAPDAASRLRLEFRKAAVPMAAGNSLSTMAVVIAGGWALGLGLRFFGAPFAYAGYIMLGMFLLFVLFSGLSLLDWKKRLQWLLMLPIRRRDLIGSVGSELVSSCARSGLAFAVAAWVLQSASTPFAVEGFAPVWPILAMWSLQFPLLAFLSLGIVSSIAFVRVILAIILLWTMLVGLGMTAAGESVTVVVLASLIGAALLLASYFFWLDVEAN